ncbi:p53 and DNA damage-regulated protein 1-like [Oncorhynchus masou masou]|uniref:p53 and DNA damage-regulated protein 1-like n=1 Tax=Oncorhynchus masou masou TaxID=90313 RepID=UPI003182BB8C
MEAERILQYLTEVEEAAEDVLANKQQIVDLDTKRNMNREALNALKHEMASEEKVKVCCGNMFIQFPKAFKTKEMIQRRLVFVFPGKPELTGYNLCPLSDVEVKAINHLMKR